MSHIGKSFRQRKCSFCVTATVKYTKKVDAQSTCRASQSKISKMKKVRN